MYDRPAGEQDLSGGILPTPPPPPLPPIPQHSHPLRRGLDGLNREVDRRVVNPTLRYPDHVVRSKTVQSQLNASPLRNRPRGQLRYRPPVVRIARVDHVRVEVQRCFRSTPSPRGRRVQVVHEGAELRHQGPSVRRSFCRRVGRGAGGGGWQSVGKGSLEGG